jgi:hypothetical protein
LPFSAMTSQAVRQNAQGGPRLILEDSFRGIRIRLGLQANYCTVTGTLFP